MPAKHNEKKRILIGLEAAAGGTIKHVVHLASSLNKEAFDVTVVYSDTRDEPRLSEFLHEMHAHGVELKCIRMHRSIHPVKDLVSFLKVMWFILKGRFDVVHAHSSKAGILFRLAAWLCKVPAIFYTPHCFYFQSLKGAKRKAFIMLERLGAMVSDKIILSDGEMRAARKHKIAGESKLSNINNAIPFPDSETEKSGLYANHIRQQLGIDSKFVVGSVGRLAPQKGWLDLIKAADYVVKQNPEVTFLIVGTGRQRSELADLIAQLNLEKHVILTGYLFDSQAVYQDLDLYVSTSHWEGLPYTILEAANFKKTIVATDLGYPTELIDDRCLTEVGDHKAVAQKILELLSDQALRQEIAEKSHEGIKNCSNYADFVRRHEALYFLSD